MKRRMIKIGVAIIGVVALALIGHVIHSSLTTPQSNTLTPIENSIEIYTTAISKIDPTHDSVLHISVTKEITIDDSTFHEISEQTVQYDVQPSGKKRIHLVDAIKSGSHSFEVSEIFCDDVIYIMVNDTPFRSDCCAEDYYATLTPAIPLTQKLYNNITGIDDGENYIISFSEPMGLESWLVGQSATPVSAVGTATIGYDGTLKSSMYTAFYQENGNSFRTTVQVNFEQLQTDVIPPEDSEVYTHIDYWKAPRLLEQACGLLLQAERISSTYTDSIYFQAFGDLRTQNITLHAHKDKQWSVYMSTEVNLINDTKVDQEITHTKKELFLDNQYAISTDGNASVSNTEITVDDVYNYFQDQLVSTLILPQHIDFAELTETEKALQIRFTGTEAFGNFLTENVCRILYDDPGLLSKTDATLSVGNLQCYLEIDKLSGLPVSSEINFTGDYKTQGLPYRIQYSAKQCYVIPSNTAKQEIETAAG